MAGTPAGSSVRVHLQNFLRAGERGSAETDGIWAARERFWAPSLMIPRPFNLQAVGGARCNQFTTDHGAVCAATQLPIEVSTSGARVSSIAPYSAGEPDCAF